MSSFLKFLSKATETFVQRLPQGYRVKFEYRAATQFSQISPCSSKGLDAVSGFRIFLKDTIARKVFFFNQKSTLISKENMFLLHVLRKKILLITLVLDSHMQHV